MALVSRRLVRRDLVYGFSASLPLIVVCYLYFYGNNRVFNIEDDGWYGNEWNFHQQPTLIAVFGVAETIDLVSFSIPFHRYGDRFTVV